MHNTVLVVLNEWSKYNVKNGRLNVLVELLIHQMTVKLWMNR